MQSIFEKVFKDPITDPGKRSKKGILSVQYISGEYKTVPITNNFVDISGNNILKTVFKDGELIIDYDWDSIKNRSKIN